MCAEVVRQQHGVQNRPPNVYRGRLDMREDARGETPKDLKNLFPIHAAPQSRPPPQLPPPPHFSSDHHGALHSDVTPSVTVEGPWNAHVSSWGDHATASILTVAQSRAGVLLFSIFAQSDLKNSTFLCYPC